MNSIRLYLNIDLSIHFEHYITKLLFTMRRRGKTPLIYIRIQGTEDKNTLGASQHLTQMRKRNLSWNFRLLLRAELRCRMRSTASHFRLF